MRVRRRAGRRKKPSYRVGARAWAGTGRGPILRVVKKALLYGFAAVGVLAFLWTVYELIVPEPTDELPERLSAPDSVPLARVLAAHLGEPVVEGNRVVPLANGEEIFPSMLEAIRSARESISFLTYVYWTGEPARAFGAELSAACRRGVETRVLIDAHGARKMDPALVDRMRAAGCRVAFFHPIRWYTVPRYNNRTHRRVLVVDGRIGYTGGVGIGSEWSGGGRRPGEWREDQFRVEGPIVRFLQGAFAENWRAATDEALSGKGLFPDLEPVGDAAIVPVLEDPGGSVSKTAFTYWLLLQRARERVWIWTPYFVPDPDLLEAIVEASRRGLDVRLLVPNERNDSRLVRWASLTYYEDLLAAGVRIFEYQPSMMHVKAVVVDDEWTVVGTANFDNRSFELNYELMLAVHDEEFAESMARRYEEDLSYTREIVPSDVERRTLLERARDWMAYLLREQI